MSAKIIPVMFMHPALALTPMQAQEVLNVSRSTLYRLRAEGKIRSTSYGRIPVAEIERHLKEEVR